MSKRKLLQRSYAALATNSLLIETKRNINRAYYLEFILQTKKNKYFVLRNKIIVIFVAQNKNKLWKITLTKHSTTSYYY